MIPLSRERRLGERRADARGGRRATDRAGSCSTAQSCPSCGGIASEVGEADGHFADLALQLDLLGVLHDEVDQRGIDVAAEAPLDAAALEALDDQPDQRATLPHRRDAQEGPGGAEDEVEAIEQQQPVDQDVTAAEDERGQAECRRELKDTPTADHTRAGRVVEESHDTTGIARGGFAVAALVDISGALGGYASTTAPTHMTPLPWRF